jgi:predicted O-methyltransferase YrrM
LYNKYLHRMQYIKQIILKMVIGKNLYPKLQLEINSLQQQSLIKPQTPLETAMLNATDISDHLMTLFMLTKLFSLQNVLELGVRTGESTIALLSAAKDISGKVVSVDMEDCWEAKSKINAFGLSSNWQFIKGNDLEIDWSGNIDHLFIDTSHTYEQTLKELQKFEPYVKSNGGVITLHDVVSFPDVLIAIQDYFSGRSDIQLFKYFHCNGIAVIIKIK